MIGLLKIMIQSNFRLRRDKLIESKLRKVDIQNWKIEPDVNEEGFIKCIELTGFPFVFRDFKGIIHDMRPKENVPSFNNFAKKDEKELYKLLVKALEKQIDTLDKNEKYCQDDFGLLKALRQELDEVKLAYKKKFN